MPLPAVTAVASSDVCVSLRCRCCRTALLAGGLDACSLQPQAGAAPQLLIQREALALLVGAAEAPSSSALPSCMVLDVRRHEERTLYGAIPGTSHMPGACCLHRVLVGHTAGRLAWGAVTLWPGPLPQSAPHPLPQTLPCAHVHHHALAPLTPAAADQLASALVLSPEAFRATYQYESPSPSTLLVMASRTSKRAHWAAQLAQDAGWHR